MRKLHKITEKYVVCKYRFLKPHAGALSFIWIAELAALISTGWADKACL